MSDEERQEKIIWKVRTSVEKWHRSEDHDAGADPDEVEEFVGNNLVNVGIDRMLDLLINAGATQAYDNTHSRIGVGDSAAAFAATQTDLQATTNKFFKVMDATYPSRTTETVTWKSTFASSDANFAWAEWGICQGTADSAVVGAPLLNRKVQAMGTKASGSTWALTVTVTLA